MTNQKARKALYFGRKAQEATSGDTILHERLVPVPYAKRKKRPPVGATRRLGHGISYDDATSFLLSPRTGPVWWITPTMWRLWAEDGLS
jgi:hypothetical protein